MTGCAQLTAPPMKPAGAQSAADIERDRSECEASARARTPSYREVLQDVLVSQGLGIGIGGAAAGLAVAARHGGIGSGSSTATTDVLIVLTSVALGFVVGSTVGLVRASGTWQVMADRFREDFAECMSTRGYR